LGEGASALFNNDQQFTTNPVDSVAVVSKDIIHARERT
jgi:hypothetical protein